MGDSLNILISNYISSTKFVFRYLNQIAKRIVIKRLSRMISNDHTLILTEFTLNSSSTEDISTPFIEVIISTFLKPTRGGIELPTRGFSIETAIYYCLITYI